MNTAVTIADSTAAGTETRWRRFMLLLLGATLVPMFFFPVSVSFHRGAAAIVATSVFITFLGSGVHVASTAFFYTDGEFRAFFRERPWRYYLVPLLLVIGTGAAIAMANVSATAYILLAYFAWQTYHYQKQNYGILSFVAAGTDRVRPSLAERFVLEASVFFGILGLLKPYALARNTALEPVSNTIYHVAAYGFFVAVPVLFVIAVASSPALRRNPIRVTCLAMGGLFYLPTFIFRNPAAAILGYAIGHGLQYLVFMYFVGASKPSRNVRLLVLSATALIGGGLLAIMAEKSFWGAPAKFVFGCYLGLVMSHFVVDAGIWKLREPFQRRYMRNAFDFVFSRGTTRAAPTPAPPGVIDSGAVGVRIPAN